MISILARALLSWAALETILQSIEIDLPVHRIYTQWTHFEEFPRFMQGVKKVIALDDRGFTGKPTSAVNPKHGMQRSPTSRPMSVLRGKAMTVTMWHASSPSSHRHKLHQDRPETFL